jgi:predicted esterase
VGRLAVTKTPFSSGLGAVLVALAAGPLAVPARAEEGALEAVAAFRRAPTVAERRAAAAAVVAAKPPFATAAALLGQPRTYAEDAPTGWTKRVQRCSDGKDRPYLLHVPKDYDRAKRYRLVVELHGGVSRDRLLSDEEFEFMKGLRAEHAEEHGYLYALPSGERGAEWWTEAGASNVLGIVQAVRREWNVDEALVFATGFSDGGSGCHYLALAHPTPFAGFVSLNGHVGVAQAGGLEVHLRNLRNKPMVAVNTDLDSLYPSKALRPVAEAIGGLGAPYEWREVTGFAHDPSYLATERERLWAWEQGVRRDPHPATVHWEGAPGAPSRVHGLGRVTVAEVGGMEPFPDVNPMLAPGRVLLGFAPDAAFEGPGVRVERVNEGSVAEEAGIAAGDVVVGLDDATIATTRDLRAALAAKKPGDDVRVRVRRGEETVETKGAFPPAEPQPAFRRGPLHGAIQVTRAGNRFEVTCGNVSAFELWLGVGTVDFEAPVVVSVNGVEAHRGRVAPDLAFLLERAAEDDDPTMLYGARLEVRVPAKKKEE